MIAHCELMGDRVAILDPPPGLNAQQVKEWRVDKAGYDSKYAALYWPWIKVFDPATGENIFVPPSGHMAGIWGRNDDTRGVHKAPANEVVRGAIDARDAASPRASTTCSTRSASTASGPSPAAASGSGAPARCRRDPAWRYLNVRRLFNYLEESILERHPVGGVRAERRRAVGQDPAHHRAVPGQRVAQGRAVRADPGRGVLRQVRRRDQPGRGHRRRPGASARSASRR